MTTKNLQQLDETFRVTIANCQTRHAIYLKRLGALDFSGFEDDGFYLNAARLDLYRCELTALAYSGENAGTEAEGLEVMAGRANELTREVLRIAKLGSGYANSTSGATRMMAMAKGEIYGELIEIYRRKLDRA